MAQILTGTKVSNADHYTIKFFEVNDDGSSNNEPTITVENIPQPEEETFYYNLTTVANIAENTAYKITCQAHPAANDTIWTDSLVQTVAKSLIVKPSSTDN